MESSSKEKRESNAAEEKGSQGRLEQKGFRDQEANCGGQDVWSEEQGETRRYQSLPRYLLIKPFLLQNKSKKVQNFVKQVERQTDDKVSNAQLPGLL